MSLIQIVLFCSGTITSTLTTFFSSVNLLLDLLKVGLYGCGTLRSNHKGFPEDLKPLLKGLGERGEYKVRQHEQLTLSLWQDNRPVVVISTNSNPTQSTTVQRKARDGTSRTVCCPQSISSYNKFMGGVDRNDQLRQYYGIRIKGRKYYKYLWWFLFDVAVTNAYILCKKHTNLTVSSVKDFRIDLAKALIGEYCSRKRRFCKDHFPRRGAVKPTAATTATITGENRGMKLYGTATPANCFVSQWKRSGGLFSHVSP